MKIVCENCSAKYSIADEKVKGKVFKIRCKKCGESIVVRGDTPEQAEAPAPVSEPAASPPPMPSPSEEEGDVETKVFDYSGYQGESSDEAVWHIVVDGQQQGPYTSAQIREYLDAGSLEFEAFIWREGFEDWIPIKDVPELSGEPAQSAAAAPAEPEPAQPEEPASSGGGLFDAPASGGGLFDQPTGGGLFGDGEEAAAEPASPFDTGAGLFGGDDAPAAAEPAAGGDVFSSTDSAPATGGLFSADTAGGDAGGGLFGDSGDGGASDIFGDAGDSGSDGLFSSADEPAASPRLDAAAMMTGQRNENSVLFSLSNLQALATTPQADAEVGGGSGGGGGGAMAAVSPAMAAPMVSGEEASGLIDIRSLASSLSAEKETSNVDDLISMGGGGGFAPSLGAPVLAPAQEGMSTGVKIGIIGGGVLAAAAIVSLIVVVLFGGEDEKSNEQIAALKDQIMEMQKRNAGGGGDTEAITALKKQLASAQKAKNNGTPAGSAEPASTSDKAAGSDTKKKSESSSKSGKSKSRSSSKSSSSKSSSSGSSSGSSSRSSSSSKSSSPAPAAAPASKKGGSDELDDLLGGSLAKPSKKKKPASSSAPKSSSSSSGSSGGLKKNLDRGDVQKGMGGVAGRVKRCGQGKRGTVTLKVVIGRTGRVISANAAGPFAGTPVGSCAARAVRAAKFPKSQNNLTVRYPFKL